MKDNKTSPHILNTSANLLGFCLFVLTALHIGNKTSSTYIDEFTSIIAFMLGISSLLSFFSIRTGNLRLSNGLEKTADYFFILALTGIIVLIVFIMMNYIE